MLHTLHNPGKLLIYTEICVKGFPEKLFTTPHRPSPTPYLPTKHKRTGVQGIRNASSSVSIVPALWLTGSDRT